MTPLRQKMIDLMTFRQFAPKTCQVYLSAVTKLTTHYHRSPEQISNEEIKQWLMGISNERKWSASTIHQTLMALKFCYEQVLEKSDFLSDFQLPKRPQKIPILLTQKEVYAILQATKNLKHLTLLSLCYGCGLRASEAVVLTQNDIDSERLLLRVVQGTKSRRIRRRSKRSEYSSFTQFITSIAILLENLGSGALFLLLDSKEEKNTGNIQCSKSV